MLNCHLPRGTPTSCNGHVASIPGIMSHLCAGIFGETACLSCSGRRGIVSYHAVHRWSGHYVAHRQTHKTLQLNPGPVMNLPILYAAFEMFNMVYYDRWSMRVACLWAFWVHSPYMGQWGDYGQCVTLQVCLSLMPLTLISYTQIMPRISVESSQIRAGRIRRVLTLDLAILMEAKMTLLFQTCQGFFVSNSGQLWLRVRPFVDKSQIT